MTPFFASLVVALVLFTTQQPAVDAGLRIVVIEGESAVNIIQRKTAVAPVIEVRDRNNLPVPGVAVTFSIGGPGASFGGLSTLTVTTNAAGQAAAVGLTPTAAGAIQINATALVQGQVLTASITQTNVLTAAQAASAGAAAGGSGSGSAGAGGAATGGGGGISGTTIGIVGAAVAGGAVAATQVAGGGDTQGPRRYTASYIASIPVTSFSTTGIAQCTFTESAAGTVTITIDDPDTAAGSVEVTEQHTITGGNCGNIGGGANDTARGPLSGGPTNLTFSVQKTNALPSNGQRTKPWSFSGQLTGNQIVGVLTTGDINDFPSGAQARGSVQVQVTLSGGS
jgi:hypothetical protein